MKLFKKQLFLRIGLLVILGLSVFLLFQFLAGSSPFEKQGTTCEEDLLYLGVFDIKLDSNFDPSTYLNHLWGNEEYGFIQYLDHNQIATKAGVFLMYIDERSSKFVGYSSSKNILRIQWDTGSDSLEDNLSIAELLKDGLPIELQAHVMEIIPAALQLCGSPSHAYYTDLIVLELAEDFEIEVAQEIAEKINAEIFGRRVNSYVNRYILLMQTKTINEVLSLVSEIENLRDPRIVEVSQYHLEILGREPGLPEPFFNKSALMRLQDWFNDLKFRLLLFELK